MTDQQQHDERPTRPDPAAPAGRAVDGPMDGPMDGSVGGSVDGRTRLAQALRRPGSRGQAVAAVLLAVLGFAAVTQVRSNGRDDAYVGARQGDLIQYINSLDLASQRTQTEITRLERTRDALGNDTQARRTALQRARQQAATLGILAGTVPAVGPGVRVKVADPTRGVGTNQMIDGLEELRDAGAEVISIGDTKDPGHPVRVVAQTSMQDTAGGGIVVDGRVLRAPYVITAIGDPHTLSTALDFTGGFISEVRAVGGKVTVDELANVRIDAVRSPQKPDYAQPTTSR